MNKLLLLVAWLVIACSTIPQPRYSFDPVLLHDYADWLEDAAVYGVVFNDRQAYVLNWAEHGFPDAGLNIKIEEGLRGGTYWRWCEVYIDRNLRDYPCLRRSVVYHELGHCMLDRMHDYEGAPTIMAPAITYHVDADTWTCDSWTDLVRDLFIRPEPLPPLDSAAQLHEETAQ